jgi:hypothetical protein
MSQKHPTKKTRTLQQRQRRSKAQSCDDVCCQEPRKKNLGQISIVHRSRIMIDNASLRIVLDGGVDHHGAKKASNNGSGGGGQDCSHERILPTVRPKPIMLPTTKAPASMTNNSVANVGCISCPLALDKGTTKSASNGRT